MRRGLPLPGRRWRMSRCWRPCCCCSPGSWPWGPWPWRAPALLASRLRAGVLAVRAERWSESQCDLARARRPSRKDWNPRPGMVGCGNRRPRLAPGPGSPCGAGACHWETAKAVFPARPGVVLLHGPGGPGAGRRGLGGAGAVNRGPGGLGFCPSARLLLLMYRPIREWARHYPVYLMGNRLAFACKRLQADLEAFPLRRPRGRLRTEPSVWKACGSPMRVRR